MTQITVQRTIEAPPELVFRTVSDVGNFSQAVPDIVNVEYLSETRSGVGTRFRETRRIKGREASTVLEVTETVENERIRLVADSHGTVWDSVFTVRPAAGGTELVLTMEARPYKVLARLMVPLTASMMRKPLENDMDAVKAYCESRAAA
jgi:uncharacterized protein YndB with AHSA1/START domain